MLIAVTGQDPRNMADLPRRQRAFAALARAALENQLVPVVTTPVQLRSAQQSLSGWSWDGSAWRPDTVRLADGWVVYDAMYLADLPRYRRELRALKKDLTRRLVPWFNPTLPMKNLLYAELAQAEPLGGVVPATTDDVSPARLVALLQDRPVIWLKPVYGSGGRNIVWIKRTARDRYQLIGERFFGRRLVETVDTDGLKKMVRYMTRYRPYVAQDDVALIRTADGRKIDFRVTVQRARDGSWVVTAITARIARPGAVLTNYHAGGEVVSVTRPTDHADDWLARTGLGRGQVQDMVRCAIQVAHILQQQRPMLGILGIDIGLSVDGRLFVYDCNARPGRDILTDEEVERFMRSVAGFAAFLREARLPS